MRVTLRNPDRTVDVSDLKAVTALLDQLRIVPEAILVIRDSTLLTRDENLTDEDELEVRPLGDGESAHLALVRKVKPLVRVAERETAAYALLRGIDYIIEECPMVEGNTQHRYKEAITLLEEASPGTKQQMYFGFLKRAAPRFAEESDAERVVGCKRCGAPSVAWEEGVTEVLCSFCKTKDLASRTRDESSRSSHRKAPR